MKNMTERLVVGGVALLVGLLLGWMVRGVTTYNSAAESVAAYDNWRVACPPAANKTVSCEMASDVADPGGRGVVGQIVITKDKGKPVIGFTLPFGVALQAGIGLNVGKDPLRTYAYRTCNQVGCVVLVPYDDKLRDSLASTDDAKLLYSGLDGKPVAVPVSLKGFPKARSAYNSAEARRSSWFWRLWS